MGATYSIYQAKARLSEIIRLVKQRHPVTITERGVPVARVVPHAEARPQSLAQRLKQLTEIGAILPAATDAKPLRGIMRKRGALRRFLAERE